MDAGLHQPLVSVIIPAYNAADHTVKTVQSVLDQTYPQIEIIVVDDGSTDDTRRKMESFGGKITYIFKKNGGACSARNMGLRIAKGSYIGLLDCDDKYVPSKIALGVEYMEKHPEAGLLHTNAYYIDRNDRVIGKGKGDRAAYHGWIKNKLIIVDLIFNPTVLIRRECFEKVGFYDEQLFPPADWDMWLRIAEHYEIAYLNEPLSMYRVSSNWNFKNLDRMVKEEAIVLAKFFERNPETPASVRNKAYSRYHFTMAKCFLVKGDDRAMQEHLKQSLKLNPFNLKANVTSLAHAIAPQRIKRYAARTMFVES